MAVQTINAMSADWAQLANGVMAFQGGSAAITAHATTIQRLQNERDLTLHSPVMQFAEAHRDLAAKYPGGFQPYTEKAEGLASQIESLKLAGQRQQAVLDVLEPQGHGLSQNLAAQGPSGARGV
jgi:hypothetical protein